MSDEYNVTMRHMEPRVIPITSAPKHMLPQSVLMCDLVPGSGRWTKNRAHLIALVKKEKPQ